MFKILIENNIFARLFDVFSEMNRFTRKICKLSKVFKKDFKIFLLEIAKIVEH